MIRKFNLLLKSTAATTLKKMSTTSEVTLETVNNKGIITLNRPKALNALNLPMVNEIYPKLKQWHGETSMVLIKGSGDRAFCSGGDIRAVTEAGKNVGALEANQFFREEYRLNHLIGVLKIPYIALIHGITMGGGVGLSVHGRYRVATEKTVFAMPETAIGLFPDVGGTYFLSRLKGYLGTYLALTGFRLNGVDVLRAGIATHFCKSQDLKSLEDELIASNVDKLPEILNRYTEKSLVAEKEDFVLESNLTRIEKIFGADAMEDILKRLEEDGSEWALKHRESLLKMSPTSCKVSLRALREGAKLNFQDCLKTELRLATGCLSGHDFYEGVRAVLIDKDNKPKWNPTSLNEVTDDIVNRFFKPLPEGQDLILDPESP